MEERATMTKENNHYWLEQGISPSSTEDGPSEDILVELEDNKGLGQLLAILDKKDPQPDFVGMH